MTVKEAARLIGKKGGEKIKKLYGKDHYRAMGKKSGRVRKAKSRAARAK